MGFKAFKIEKEMNGITAEKAVEEFINRYGYDPDLVLSQQLIDRWWKIKRAITRKLGKN